MQRDLRPAVTANAIDYVPFVTIARNASLLLSLSSYGFKREFAAGGNRRRWHWVRLVNAPVCLTAPRSPRYRWDPCDAVVASPVACAGNACRTPGRLRRTQVHLSLCDLAGEISPARRCDEPTGVREWLPTPGIRWRTAE